MECGAPAPLLMRKPSNKSIRLPLLLLLATLPLLAAAQQQSRKPQPAAAAAEKSPPPASATAATPGNEACAKCHSDIAASYAQTAMARASGPATDQLMPADFTHAASGVHYRVYAENNAAMLSFDRPDDPAMHGTRRLQYFIGSGHRGRTYLFSLDGFFFESPVNWYAQKKIWDTAPAFQQSRVMPMNLAAFPGCLNCHSSASRAPIAGTENKYDMPLFAHDGITCERCHGDNSAHIAAGGKGNIVNPSKLAPARRDDVCMQCHLEGNVAIEQPHRKLADYLPGQDLGDDVHYYLYVDQESQQIRALGQSEALWQSVCKIKSGDKLTCTTCHDPHSTPAPEQRVAFYRAKCLMCHGDAVAQKHHADQPDCTSCHMPRTTTSNIAHTQATDHRILKLPMMPLQSLQTGAAAELVRFPPPPSPTAAAGATATNAANPAATNAANSAARPPSQSQSFTTPAPAGDARDLALAWESIAQEGHSSAATEAERNLNQAILEHPDDPVLLDTLAFLAQRSGDLTKAREFYEHALRIDPLIIDAAANLGVIEARAGHFDRAVALWEPAFNRAPGRSAIGMNLAHIACDAGQFDKARAYVARVLQFNPDSPAVKTFAKQIATDPPNCKSR
jgi:predicted CXXCH cytochrome family protein